MKKQNCVIWNRCFILYIKTDGIYKYIVENVKTRFNTSNYELHRLLLKGKKIKIIGLIKDELGGKIMIAFIRLKAKTCSYLINDSSEDKKAKGTKTCAIKRKLKFENCKNCLEATQLENKISYIEKNKINIDCLKKS